MELSRFLPYQFFSSQGLLTYVCYVTIYWQPSMLRIRFLGSQFKPWNARCSELLEDNVSTYYLCFQGQYYGSTYASMLAQSHYVTSALIRNNYLHQWHEHCRNFMPRWHNLPNLERMMPDLLPYSQDLCSRPICIVVVSYLLWHWFSDQTQ